MFVLLWEPGSLRYPCVVHSHVAPSLVCGTNMTQKRGWKAASEVRLWDAAASGLVVFLLPLGLLTQGRASCHVLSSPVEGPASEDLRPAASRRCWNSREALGRAGPGGHLDGHPMRVDTPGGLDGKESACNAGDPGSVPGLGTFPWRREWEPTPVFLPGESHGQRNLTGYSPWGPKELDTTEQLTLSLCFFPYKTLSQSQLKCFWILNFRKC